MCHRQVDIGDPLLARYVREVEGEDEVDVVGSPAHQECYNHYHHYHCYHYYYHYNVVGGPAHQEFYYYHYHFYHYYYHYNMVGGPAHHEDRHHHPEHFHLVEENTENRKQMSYLIQGLRSV